MEGEAAAGVSIADFLIVTLILGGGAAYLTGRAISLSWEPYWRAALWMLPLAGAVRFVHFAFFHGAFLSPLAYLIDLAVLLAAAFLGHRLSRAREMARRYPWSIVRDGPLAWRARGGGA